jgi:hypothetical protein
MNYPRATIALTELADTSYYYWRKSIEHTAGDYYQGLTMHETQMLYFNLRFKWLLGFPI